MPCAVRWTLNATRSRRWWTRAPKRSPRRGPADAALKEGQLSQALGKLFALAESYPTLKSNENVKMLQEELSGTENKVGFARQFYNDIATKFNTKQQVFLPNIFPGMFGFKPAELFEITDTADRDAVPQSSTSRR